MKIANIFILFLFILTSCIDSSNKGKENPDRQGNTDTIEKTISFGRNNIIRNIKKTNDGNYLILIQAEEVKGDKSKITDYFVKIRPNGNTIFSRKIELVYGECDFVELNNFVYILSSPADDAECQDEPDYISKYSTDFKLEWTKEIGKSNCLLSNRKLLKGNDNDLLFISSSVEEQTDGNGCLSIKKLNFEGEIIAERKYKITGNFYNISASNTMDNNYFLSVEITENNKDRLWLLKLNQTLDTLWTRTNFDIHPKNIIELSNSAVIIYGCNYFTRQGDPGSLYYLQVLKINKEGDLIWSKEFKENYLADAGNVVELTGGNYLFSSAIEPTMNNSNYAYIFELDQNGEKVFEKKFSFNLGYQSVPYILQSKDSIFILSQKWIGKSEDPFHDILQVTKLTK